MSRTCSVMSYDYRDLDVVLNVCLFYQSAGWRVIEDRITQDTQLVVILRGDPGESLHAHRGIVHVYDYEKGRVIDWSTRLPKAHRIYLISLTLPEHSEGATYVQGYVPVVPRLWQRPGKAARQPLVHVANFKFIKDDPYQLDLLNLVRSGRVEVFGGNWAAAGIEAQRLSHLEANATLSGARACIGLMYPNQRGRTLSGRMWQAPLNGCRVISEMGTNIVGCPGVEEIPSFTWDSIRDMLDRRSDPEALALEARRFWESATARLAADLGLSLHPAWSRRSLIRSHAELLFTHGRLLAERVRGRVIGPRRLARGLNRLLSGRSNNSR